MSRLHHGSLCGAATGAPSYRDDPGVALPSRPSARSVRSSSQSLTARPGCDSRTKASSSALSQARMGGPHCSSLLDRLTAPAGESYLGGASPSPRLAAPSSCARSESSTRSQSEVVCLQEGAGNAEALGHRGRTRGAEPRQGRPSLVLGRGARGNRSDACGTRHAVHRPVWTVALAHLGLRVRRRERRRMRRRAF